MELAPRLGAGRVGREVIRAGGNDGGMAKGNTAAAVGHPDSSEWLQARRGSWGGCWAPGRRECTRPSALGVAETG